MERVRSRWSCRGCINGNWSSEIIAGCDRVDTEGGCDTRGQTRIPDLGADSQGYRATIRISCHPNCHIPVNRGRSLHD